MNIMDLEKPVIEINTVGKYKKLIKRLSFGIKEGYIGSGDETELNEVLKMDESLLRKIPYFGVKYIELFRSLRSEFSSGFMRGEMTEISGGEYSSEFRELSCTVKISHANLSKKTLAALKKFSSKGLDVSVTGLLDLKKSDLMDFDGIGMQTINTILEIKSACEQELNRHLRGEVSIQSFESALLIPKNSGELTLEDIDAVLLEDLDAYLERLPEIDLVVFCKRFGFTESKATLQEIGKDFGVTRERIRQIETKVQGEFVLSKRLTSSFLENKISENLNINMASSFPLLAECFESEGDLLRFLSICSNGLDIEGKLRPHVDQDILTEIFVFHGCPISKTQLLEFLEPIIESDFNLDLVLDYLVDKESLRVEGDLYFPKNLSKVDAVACILAQNKTGLPWKDAARIINGMNICRTKFTFGRKDNHAFSDTENVFLAKNGSYSHTKFLPIDKDLFEVLIKNVKAVLKEYSRNAAHLIEIVDASYYLQTFDYYALRYIVKMFGPDEGLFFYGKSQSDTVSFESGYGTVNQKEVILQKLRSSKTALTKSEIAQLIKSKSLFHASVYIDEMTRDKRVVQVDRMLYTTPENAFDGVDVGRLSEFLKSEIVKLAKPVHPSALKSIANFNFGYSYSWKFYHAFLKFWSEDLELYRSSHFYSDRPIQFESFVDFFNLNINSQDSAKRAKEISEEYLAVDSSVAERAFWNWRNAKKY